MYPSAEQKQASSENSFLLRTPLLSGAEALRYVPGNRLPSPIFTGWVRSSRNGRPNVRDSLDLRLYTRVRRSSFCQNRRSPNKGKGDRRRVRSTPWQRSIITKSRAKPLSVPSSAFFRLLKKLILLSKVVHGGYQACMSSWV